MKLERRRAAGNAGRPYATREERAAQRASKLAERAVERARIAAEKEAARAELIRLKPWLEPGIGSGEKYRRRYALDPEFNLRERLRAQVRDRRKVKYFEEGLRRALKGRGSGAALADFLGYEIADLRRHFERLFGPGMSWAAFARGEIHIGHRIPLAAFDLGRDDEIRAAWALHNLQPEWAGDNIKRGARRDVLI